MRIQADDGYIYIFIRTSAYLLYNSWMGMNGLWDGPKRRTGANENAVTHNGTYVLWPVWFLLCSFFRILISFPIQAQLIQHSSNWHSTIQRTDESNPGHLDFFIFFVEIQVLVYLISVFGLFFIIFFYHCKCTFLFPMLFQFVSGRGPNALCQTHTWSHSINLCAFASLLPFVIPDADQLRPFVKSGIALFCLV